jgi:hypothetical protein
MTGTKRVPGNYQCDPKTHKKHNNERHPISSLITDEAKE